MLRTGLKPALGTDSLASNRDLGLWGEMETVQQAFPEIDPWEIIRMATINGASALDLSGKLGDLAPGKMARMFFLPLNEVNKAELPSAIIHSGGQGLEWLS
jgi:cytosine/adenosine deaminase-related metal-dependent hydrolase